MFPEISPNARDFPGIVCQQVMSFPELPRAVQPWVNTPLNCFISQRDCMKKVPMFTIK